MLAKSAQAEFHPLTPERWGDFAAVWTGLASSFRKAGFNEVARRSETRPIMRYQIRRKS